MNDVHLSYLDMFLAADPVVKLVIVILLVASVACWALIADVAIQVNRLRRGIEGRDGGALAALLPSGRDAAAKASHLPSDQRHVHVEIAMRHVLAQEFEIADRSLPALGVITTAAPFVGLFGTVWGIMHSFGAIAAAQDTSLSVVAPGIAEALLATALGLAAAIPAAVGHMRFSGALSRLNKKGQRLIERLALDQCLDSRREP
jgi:biopolymer transport protein ExbB/TolQ